MITTWLVALLRRRFMRLGALAIGVAMSVGLLGALGAFLSASQAAMTHRATASVATDWQVEVQPGASPATALKATRSAPGIGAALPVTLTRVPALRATDAGTTQVTGAAVVVGLPPGYRAAFPAQIRPLTGSPDGVLLAQQTASNLHAHPGPPSPSTARAQRQPGSGSTGSSTCPRLTPCSRRSVLPRSHSPARHRTTS